MPAEVCELLGGLPADVVRISAKTGVNVEQVLDAIVKRIPRPDGVAARARLLVFDSSYDQYRGVIAFVRVVDGRLPTGQGLRAMAMGTDFDAEEARLHGATARVGAEAGGGGIRRHGAEGRFAPACRRHPDHPQGRRGSASREIQDIKPMVFAGLFQTESDDYPELRDAPRSSALNDAALFYEPETSQALGPGFLLRLPRTSAHGDRPRAARESSTSTSSSRRRTSRTRCGRKTPRWIEVHNPAEMPREAEVQEPFVRAQVIVPKDSSAR